MHIQHANSSGTRPHSDKFNVSINVTAKPNRHHKYAWIKYEYSRHLTYSQNIHAKYHQKQHILTKWGVVIENNKYLTSTKFGTVKNFKTSRSTFILIDLNTIKPNILTKNQIPVNLLIDYWTNKLVTCMRKYCDQMRLLVNWWARWLFCTLVMRPISFEMLQSKFKVKTPHLVNIHCFWWNLACICSQFSCLQKHFGQSLQTFGFTQ